MDNKELLIKLIPAIEQIDGGCFSCANDFITHANAVIKPLGFKYELNEYSDMIVTLIETT